VGTTELAHLSDHLFSLAIATYSIAMVCFCAEYAFGRQGRVAATSGVPRAAETPAAAKVLVGAVGVVAPPPATAADVAPTDAGRHDARRAVAGRAGRAGIGVAVFGVLLHAASIAIRGAAVDRVPWGNMYEFSSVAGLVAVLAFLTVLIRQPRLRYLGVFVLLPVIVLMFLAGTVLYAAASPLVPALHSYWLAIHVSSAAVGTGIFMVSSVATLLYLVRMRYEHVVVAGNEPRSVASMGARLPGSDALDRMAYRTVAFGFPVYTFGIICGAIWAEAAWGKYWSWDPKETWALITWVVYAAYLHARATAGWKGSAASVINLIGFTTLVFNFFVVNIVVAGLHSYAGLN